MDFSLPGSSTLNGEIPTTPQLLDEIMSRLRHARAVQIVGHVRPDGDCIGSMLALHHLLGQLGVPNAMAAEEMPTNGYDALDGFHLIRSEPAGPLHPDLVVFLDCSNIERGLTRWTPPAPVINIDHHAGNRRYGELNWIDPSAAATGEMLFHLVEHARLALTPPMAEALLVALTTDTGSFRFSNTGPRQHLIAARLIEAGASAQRVSRIAFDSHPLDSVRVTGYVLSHVRLECAGQLAWSEIRQEAYQQFGGERNAPENLADALRSIRGVKLSVLFHEMEDGALRVNFRSTGELNVGQFAARWGGGGHPAAAGLYLTGAQFDRDRDLILQAAMELFAGREPPA